MPNPNPHPMVLVQTWRDRKGEQGDRVRLSVNLGVPLLLTPDEARAVALSLRRFADEVKAKGRVITPSLTAAQKQLTEATLVAEVRNGRALEELPKVREALVAEFLALNLVSVSERQP